MEIQNFKMRVTPEQSRIVQQTLFNNGCQWESGRKEVICIDKPFLYLEDESIQFDSVYSGAFYNSYNLPELTFQEFFDRYVKLCIKPRTEDELWKIYYHGASLANEGININYYYHYPPIDKIAFAFDEPQEGYIELTFEQFKQYVLKTKDMEKIDGYKLKESCKQYEQAALEIINCDTLCDVTRNKKNIYKWRKAGVLDLWFEPVYEQEKILYFGDVKFTIKDGYADTEYGKVTKEEIKNAISWIENPPRLNKYEFGIRVLGSCNTYNLEQLETSEEAFIAFGCKKGTYVELKAIYNAM